MYGFLIDCVLYSVTGLGHAWIRHLFKYHDHVQCTKCTCTKYQFSKYKSCPVSLYEGKGPRIYIAGRRDSNPPSSSVGRTLPTSLRLLCRQLYRRTSSVVYWRQSGERLGESFQLTMMGGAIYIRILWNRSSYPTKAWTNFFSLIVMTNSPTNSFIEIFAISFFVTKIFNFPIFRFLQCTIILRTIFANV